MKILLLGLVVVASVCAFSQTNPSTINWQITHSSHFGYETFTYLNKYPNKLIFTCYSGVENKCKVTVFDVSIKDTVLILKSVDYDFTTVEVSNSDTEKVFLNNEQYFEIDDPELIINYPTNYKDYCFTKLNHNDSTSVIISKLGNKCLFTYQQSKDSIQNIVSIKAHFDKDFQNLSFCPYSLITIKLKTIDEFDSNKIDVFATYYGTASDLKLETFHKGNKIYRFFGKRNYDKKVKRYIEEKSE